MPAIRDMSTTIPVQHDWTAAQWDWPLQHNDGIVKIHNTSEKFEVGLEVQYFTPKEITVNVINDEIVIDCSHQERNDPHGRVTREIHRTYHLPPDVDRSSIKTNLTQSGTLVITGNKKR